MAETKKCPKCKEEIATGASKCPKCQSDLRNWFVRHKILSAILAFLSLIVILNLGSGSATNKTTVNEPTAGEKDTVTIAEKEEKSYQEVFVFSGNGAKKSEPFTIVGDRFKVKYNCSGDLCQAFLYKVGNDIPKGLIVNTTDPTNDETIFYGADDYYIDSNSIGSYTITVEDYL